MTKLVPKPCPRCGSDDVGLFCDGEWNVECGNCGLVGPSGGSAAAAAREWNDIPDEPEEDRSPWLG